MVTHPPRPKRFTRTEYYSMAELGLFGDKRVELIEGEIIEMSPQTTPHSSSIRKASTLFHDICPSGMTVSVQLPLYLGLRSEPEPDLYISKGAPGDFSKEHPTSAVLVVEIARSSVNFDRKRKGSLYAKYGIPELWLVNLIDMVIEVFREPVKDKEAIFGSRYSNVKNYRPGQEITPLHLAGVRIKVSDVLP
jgi:Uma2 family endonuclease